MSETKMIRGIADTARWVAMYRAVESERKDAHFRDPFARRLAGVRGEEIYRSLPKPMRNAAWSVVARTVQFDRIVMDAVAEGSTMVINLAAGLDTRPYRLPLPPTLTWVEVDEAPLFEEKRAILADAMPVCHLERVALDLTREAERHELFVQLNARAHQALVLTEGLIMYLPQPAVESLARELAQHNNFLHWATDIISPRLLRMIDDSWGNVLREGNSPMQFAVETPDWFETVGWRVLECRSAMIEAKGLHRLPWLLRLMAGLVGERYNPKQPWSGSCLLERAR